ncbi:MAG: tyrosine-type recombinase/integrase [Bacteroidales bacterium]
MDTKELFRNYLQVQKRYSPRTLELYMKSVEELYGFLSPQEGEQAESLLQPKHIRAFTAQLLKTGYSPVTVNLKLSAISTYCNLLVKKGLLKSNPVKKIHRPKNEKRLPGFYTADAMEGYFDYEKDTKEVGEEVFPEDFLKLRDRVLTELLYCTGIRRAEAASLKLFDFDKKRGVVRVTGKGDKSREVPVPDDFSMALAGYIELQKDFYSDNPGKYLFLTDSGQPMYLSFVNKIVKRELSGKAGFSGKKSPHMLRHSLATHLLNNGADLNSIKEVLGHSSLAATQVYTHNSFEKLKKVFLTAHPRAKKGG